MKKVIIAMIVSAFAAAGIVVATTQSSSVTVQSGDVQLAGRTNVHSGGRAGGKALGRIGNENVRKSTGWH